MGLPGWHLHWDVWLVIGGLYAAYLLAWRARGKTVPPAQDPHRRRKIALFSVGVGLLLLGADWPVHDLSEDYLFSVHMFQHLLFSLVGPAFILAGVPDWMARALLRPAWLRHGWRFVTRPLLAFIIFNGFLLLSHWPAFVNASVSSELFHLGAHVALFGASIVMWWPVLSPLPEMPPISRPAQMVYLFLMSLAPTVPASFLTFGESPMYHAYEAFPRIWGISAIDDQRMAGLLMKLAGGFILWGMITAIFFKWHAEEERNDGWDALKVQDVDREVTTEVTR
ncbi:MAG: cytochrome c oxidase assembly protein [Actinomycetota bacterium]